MNTVGAAAYSVGINTCMWVRLHDHTETHHTLGRSSLDEWSASCRDLHLTIHHSLDTNIHAPRGIWNCNPCMRAAIDSRLTPCGHLDRYIRLYSYGIHCVCIMNVWEYRNCFVMTALQFHNALCNTIDYTLHAYKLLKMSLFQQQRYTYTLA
jgi:hypothetical protein